MINNQEVDIESVVENNQENDHEQSFAEEALNDNMNIITEESSLVEKKHTTSNGLENFGVEEESAPDLFNSDNEDQLKKALLNHYLKKPKKQRYNLINFQSNIIIKKINKFYKSI